MSDGDAAKLADELTPEQIFLINDMIHAWIEPEKKGEFRAAFRLDCKRLLATTLTREAELRRALEPCQGEQEHFEEWAKSAGYDMHEHPLHYLFLDVKTNEARKGWKAALRYALAALSSEGQEKKSQSSDGGGKLAPANRRVGSETISPVAGDTKHQGSRIAGVATGPSEALALNEGDCKPAGSQNCDEAFEAYRVKAFGRHNAYPIDVYVAFCAGFNVAGLHSPPDSVSINDPHDLRVTLATMKSAKEKRVNMNIWDRDIKAVEDALATIEAMRCLPAAPDTEGR